MAFEQTQIEQTLTADGSTNPLGFKGVCSLYCAGTFGGGALTFQVSYDSGTTWLRAKDITGSALTFTSNDAIDFQSHGSALMRATLAGATTPSVFIRMTI